MRVLRNLWCRPAAQLSLIVEHGGQLRYFTVSALSQRLLTRSGLVLSALALLALLYALASTARSKLGATPCGQSHQAAHGSEEKSLGHQRVLRLADERLSPHADAERLMVGDGSLFSGDRLRLRASQETISLELQGSAMLAQSGAPPGAFPPLAPGCARPDAAPRLADLDSAGHGLWELLSCTPSRMPLDGARITSHFGDRTHPVTGIPKLHAGIDLAPEGDDRVYPAKNGLVVLARAHGSYGNTVVVRHERGIESLYAHLERIDVTQGQAVTVDSLLGLAGSTGRSIGKHLHFEISVGGVPVDPAHVLQAFAHARQDPKQFSSR